MLWKFFVTINHFCLSTRAFEFLFSLKCVKLECELAQLSGFFVVDQVSASKNCSQKEF